MSQTSIDFRKLRQHFDLTLCRDKALSTALAASSVIAKKDKLLKKSPQAVVKDNCYQYQRINFKQPEATTLAKKDEEKKIQKAITIKLPKKRVEDDDDESGAKKITWKSCQMKKLLEEDSEFWQVDEFYIENILIMKQEENKERQRKLAEYQWKVTLGDVLKKTPDEMAAEMGKSSLLYLLLDLKTKLTTLLDRYPGEISGMSQLMFGWSIDDIFRRLKNPLTAFNKLVSCESDVDYQDLSKFRVDLRELLQLVELIYNDIKADRNVAEYSKVDVGNSLLNLRQLAEKPQQALLQQHTNLLKGVYRAKKSTLVEGLRRDVKELSAQVELKMPIENRYRVKFMHNQMEQISLKDEIELQQLDAEIERIKNLTEEDQFIFDCVEMQYNNLIVRYTEEQQRLEKKMAKDVDAAEAELQNELDALDSINVDMQFYQDEVAKFEAEIKYVQDKQAAEEAAEIKRQLELELLAELERIKQEEKQKKAQKKKLKKNKKKY